jgi:5'-nucleotidase
MFFFVACSHQKEVVILSTNDTHSQVEPIVLLEDEGGYVSRLAIIDSIRQKEKDLLLLDAGDLFQGTPYFNFFGGRVEIEAYNRMGYDAIVLGNHEFDCPLDSLAERLKNAQFEVLCANYDVSGTVLEGIVKPYAIFEKNKSKIGVIGLGINPKGLVLQTNYKGIEFLNPIKKANEIADFLRNKEHCDFVIVLSHLGSDYADETISDVHVASQSRNIDLIIGGHTHKIVNKKVINLCGDSVLLVQSGKMGCFMNKTTLQKK